MIYFGLDPIAEILESFYLSESLTTKLSEATIVVNPRGLNYLFGKTVIINKTGIPKEPLQEASRNNTLVYRVPYPEDYPEGIHSPYLPKILPEITWTGEIIEDEITYETAKDVNFIYSSKSLSYPKLKTSNDLYGSPEDLSYLGYLQYQLGQIEFPSETIYQDLDLVKTGKFF